MNTRITFNGHEYGSPDEMPPEIRQAYERAMAAVRSGTSSMLTPRVNIKVSTNVRFVHDGHSYDSVDEMPPGIRSKYQAAMQQIDKDHDGIPDVLQGSGGLPAATAPSGWGPSFEASPPLVDAAAGQDPVVASESPGNRLLLIAGAVIILLIFVVLGLVLYIAYR